MVMVLAGCTGEQLHYSLYFCPQDECAKRIIEELAAAEEEIVFASFTFTHPNIATGLILQHHRNVSVKGFMEKSNSKKRYSQYGRLEEQGIEMNVDNRSGLMHNKFFVIDNKTVITGSFNPSKNADRRNAENILIIHHAEIARKYREEFESLWMN